MQKYQRLPSDILSRLDDLPAALAAHQQVVFVYFFGGLARGEVRPLSDVDIAVYLNATDTLAVLGSYLAN